ncbi:MAG: imidazole glycerol phosphate synthase subunit HisF [Rickettsiales bacterium]|nr:imidazole glycerol phosphate synthase subunit HisF [Rickettsiales bacterium]|tara:strand:+ start:132 stop:902 length:771 start_codon:yes stop_codon:yes gene_type:complete
MLKTRVIPCLDVKDGRVVKGINFFNLKDAGDPVEQAKIYDLQGADELCFLDITASIEKRDLLYDIINKTAKNCFMPLTVGGGISSIEDIRKLLFYGADKVSINSSAIYNPNLITEAAERFGSQCIVVAIDAKKTNKKNFASGYEVFSHGGTMETNLDVLKWTKKCASLGAGEILLTSMNNDGTKKGFNINLTKMVTDSITIPVIASGGVGELKHFTDGVLKANASGLLAASVFHYGKFTIRQVKKELYNAGIPVRI